MVAGGTLLAWLTATTGILSIGRNAFQLGANQSLTFDGPVVLLLGLVIMAMGVARLTNTAMPRFVQSSPLVAGLAAAVVLGLEYSSLHDWVNQVSGAYATASIGTGYWICCAGALITVFAGLSSRRKPA